MLNQASDFTTTAFADRWWLPVWRLFAESGKDAACGRLPGELTTLSDRLLVDIGVDPRCVPNPAGETIPRPDLTYSGLVPPIWRSTAKS